MNSDVDMSAAWDNETVIKVLIICKQSVENKSSKKILKVNLKKKKKMVNAWRSSAIVTNMMRGSVYKQLTWTINEWI